MYELVVAEERVNLIWGTNYTFPWGPKRPAITSQVARTSSQPIRTGHHPSYQIGLRAIRAEDWNVGMTDPVARRRVATLTVRLWSHFRFSGVQKTILGLDQVGLNRP